MFCIASQVPSSLVSRFLYPSIDVNRKKVPHREIFTDVTSPFFYITLIFFIFFSRLYKTWEIRKEIKLLSSGHIVMTSSSLSLCLSLSQMWDSSSSILDTVMASASTVSIHYLSYLITCVYVLYILPLYYVFGGLLSEKTVSLKSPGLY